MRDIKLLLELLLIQVQQCEQVNFYGMCGQVSTMNGNFENAEPVRGCYIFDFEYQIILDFFISHRPYEKLSCGQYWWKSGEKQPRIDWLKLEIEKL